MSEVPLYAVPYPSQCLDYCPGNTRNVSNFVTSLRGREREREREREARGAPSAQRVVEGVGLVMDRGGGQVTFVLGEHEGHHLHGSQDLR